MSTMNTSFDSIGFISLWKETIDLPNDNDDLYYAKTSFNDFIVLWEENANISNIVLDGSNSSVSGHSSLIDTFKPYQTFFESIHMYLGLVVGVFGVIANIINITVFTRKNMSSSINIILLSLAVADMMVLLNHNVKTVLGTFQNDSCVHSFTCKVTHLVVIQLSAISYFISIWVTVLLAVWRVMAVCYPISTEWCRSLTRAKVAIALTYASCTILYIPYLLILTITENGNDEYETYRISLNEFYYRHLVSFINLWSFLGCMFYMLVPCAFLTVLNLCLIRAMRKATKKRKTLRSTVNNDERHNRTTKMLIVVLTLFLFTNFPRGILLLLHHLPGWYEGYFYSELHSIFEKTLSFLTLVNSAVNFVVYCSIGKQFRETFVALLCSTCKQFRETFVTPVWSRWEKTKSDVVTLATGGANVVYSRDRNEPLETKMNSARDVTDDV